MIFDDVWWFLGLSLPKCGVPSIHSKHSALRRNASLAQTTWRWAYKEVEAHCPHNLSEIRDISGTRLLVNTRRKRLIFRRPFSCYTGLYLIFWTLLFEPAQCCQQNAYICHSCPLRNAQNIPFGPMPSTTCPSTEWKKKVMSSTVLWLHFRRMDCRSMAETFSEPNIWVWLRIGHQKKTSRK